MIVIRQQQEDGGILIVDYRTYTAAEPDWFVTRTTPDKYYYSQGDTLDLAMQRLAREMAK